MTENNKIRGRIILEVLNLALFLAALYKLAWSHPLRYDYIIIYRDIACSVEFLFTIVICILSFFLHGLIARYLTRDNILLYIIISCIIFTSISLSSLFVLTLNELIFANKISTQYVVRIISILAVAISHILVLGALRNNVVYFNNVTPTVLARAAVLPICMALILSNNVFGLIYLVLFTLAAINPSIIKDWLLNKFLKFRSLLGDKNSSVLLYTSIVFAIVYIIYEIFYGSVSNAMPPRKIPGFGSGTGVPTSPPRVVTWRDYGASIGAGIGTGVVGNAAYEGSKQAASTAADRIKDLEQGLTPVKRATTQFGDGSTLTCDNSVTVDRRQVAAGHALVSVKLDKCVYTDAAGNPLPMERLKDLVENKATLAKK